MMKRGIAFILCLSMIFSFIVPVAFVFADTEVLSVEYDGSRIENISINHDEKKVLSAVMGNYAPESCQWQILVDSENGIWADIYDKITAECEISYALVKSILETSGKAALRCKVQSENGWIYSNEVEVRVTFDEKQPEETETEPVLVSDMEVIAFPEEEVFEETGEAEIFMAETSWVSAPVVFADGEGEETEYVTITIKYLDFECYGKDTEIAIYSSYVATIVKGSAFKQEVLSPTYLGFAPYYDANRDGDVDEDASVFYLDFAEGVLTEDIEYLVYYKPILVPYGVRYFFQNINDDLYTEKAEYYHTHEALTGTIIDNKDFDDCTAITKDTTGFELMYHIPDSVAADGSTVFELYYDRNYYLIQFDFAGGYGSDPIYARFDTPFVVNDPVKHGYVFKGWDLNGDGVEDPMPDTIPAENRKYTALWETADTTYTVVYWLKNFDGSYGYVGSKVAEGQSGTEVSGSDDVASANVCGLEEHTHDNTCNICGISEHAHTSVNCYSYITTLGDEVTNYWDINAINAANEDDDGYSAPESGYIYLIQATWDINYGIYWPKIVLDGKYYTVEINNKSSVYYSDLTDILDGNEIASGIVGDYTAKKYKINVTCDETEHTHTTGCFSCKLDEHTHSDACTVDAKYFVFEGADSDVLVEGDGSTVVNVYYKPKEYTLRFYYAATTGTGTDTDSDGIADTYETVKIIGGTTYYFGSWGTNTSDDATLLNNVFINTNDGVGKVTKLPQLNAKGKARNYTLGTLVSGPTTYHYIEFTAGYGQNISNLWPCDVFNSVTRTSANTHGNWSGKEAFVSAWNGEHHVWYSQNNPNQTIKGNYEKLDDKILFASKFTDETTVSYLCFWENGANIDWSVPELYHYNIYVELPDEMETDKEKVSYEGKTYYLYQSYDTVDDSNIEGQTAVALEGYKFKERTSETITDFNTNLYKEAYEVNFFYDAENYNLAFYNHSGFINGKGGEVDYNVPLQSYFDFAPEYPTTLEPNAYEFAGWYTIAECYDESKISGTIVKDANGNATGYDVGSLSMPAKNLTLYAKWAPVDHEVLFFEDLDAMNAYIGGDTSVDVFEKHIVKHGEVIGPVEGPEDRWENSEDTGNDDKKLVFSGWYYIESGEKKAFTPADFPIKKDMKIFADWGGTTHTPFKISYITYDENGEKVKIADDYTGFAIVGTTKTFNAKAGSPLNQLYPKYNDDAYFPLVASHSITMQYDSAKYAQDATVNVYEFEYVKAEIPIDYKVQYINKETGLSLLPDAEKNTTKAVITERFRAINGYIPDAFYKRLVISVEYDEETKKFVGNDEENVLIFYYTPNTTSAYYAVHFMLEKLDATDETRQQYNIDGTGGYEESGTHIEGIGDVNSTVEITPQTFPGFTLIDNKGIEVDDLNADGVIESGEMTTDKTLNTDGEYEIKITQNGTELYIFYSRNSYPYSVYYYLYNTKDPVPNGTDSNGDTTYQPHKTNIMAKYGSEVTEEAVKIPGYTCVSATKQSLLIREETAQNKNEIIFYYSPTKYTVEYKAVPPEGGTLSATIEVITGQKDFTGSVPTANPGWKFESWYTNEECTVAVCDFDGTVEDGTNKFVPEKDELSETESNIFYAKFVPDVAPLTIVRKNPCDTDQVYVYKISWQNDDDQTESITVTISDFVKDENDEWVGSVTVRNLTLGKKYTVTQINDWSWRNNDSPIEITHEGNPDSEGNLQGTAVTFSDAEAKDRWLNGLSTLVKNIYGKLTVKQGGDADDE